MMRYKRWLEFDLVANFSSNFFHRFFASIKNFKNIKRIETFYFKITYRMKIFSTDDDARRIYFIRTEITYLFSPLFQL